MKSIDVKSLVIGILGALLVFVLMGQTKTTRLDIECVVLNMKHGPMISCRRFDLLEPPKEGMLFDPEFFPRMGSKALQSFSVWDAKMDQLLAERYFLVQSDTTEADRPPLPEINRPRH